jgi:hypothetical protein
MAKPPAIPPQPALVDARARRTARAAARRPVRPPPKRSGGGGIQLFFFGLAFIGMAAFAAPACVLLVFGMVPTIVAYVVDRNTRPMLAFTIAPLNLAGLMPYLLELWTGGDRMSTVVHLLSNVYVWLVIYLAAGAGWLLFAGMPAVVAVVLQRSLDRRKAKLKTLQRALRDDWGAEVGGSRDST